MKKSHYSESQIVKILKEVAGITAGTTKHLSLVLFSGSEQAQAWQEAVAEQASCAVSRAGADQPLLVDGLYER